MTDTERSREPEAGVAEAERFDRELRHRTFERRWPAMLVSIMAISLALYHLYTAAFPIFSAHQHRALHLAGILGLAFLLFPATARNSRTRLPFYDLLLAAAGIGVNLYILWNFGGIVERGISAFNTTDLVMATVLLVLLLEATRRLLGWGLPTLCVLFLLYGYLGRVIPIDLFAHRGYALDDMAGYMYMGLEGIYGTALGVSATYIILFIVFGAIMAKSGLGQFFNDLAMALAGRSKGGPAKVAVVSSGFMGSINGSALANVVSTGAFTIPLMKRVGYRANFAGAIEASASVGGQILPPIMGAAAFIMAETLGVSYTTIILAGLLPALLYYLGVISQVHLRADRLGMVGMSSSDIPRVKEVMAERGHLLVPILFLIFMLFVVETSVTYAAFWTIIVTLVLRATSPRDAHEHLATLGGTGERSEAHGERGAGVRGGRDHRRRRGSHRIRAQTGQRNSGRRRVEPVPLAGVHHAHRDSARHGASLHPGVHHNRDGRRSGSGAARG